MTAKAPPTLDATFGALADPVRRPRDRVFDAWLGPRGQHDARVIFGGDRPRCARMARRVARLSSL